MLTVGNGEAALPTAQLSAGCQAAGLPEWSDGTLQPLQQVARLRSHERHDAAMNDKASGIVR